MEQTQEFRSIIVVIESLEEELLKCNQKQKDNKQKYEEVEREIEDHFARCESALAARKQFLLNECSSHLNSQGMKLPLKHLYYS